MFKYFDRHNNLIFSWGLVYQLTRRNIQIRYRGSILGLLWSLVTPILMLAMYTFVFGTILDLRWTDQEGGNPEFATILFSGLIVHAYFSECLHMSVDLIPSNRQYVKKVVFPLTSLTLVVILTAAFQMIVSTFVLLLYLVIVERALVWTVVLIPVAIFPLMLMAMGFSWMIAASAVYFRDLGQLVGLVTLALLFISPVFYETSRLPDVMQPWLYANPITWIIESVRALLFDGKVPSVIEYLIYLVAAFSVSVAGLLLFRKLRPGFSDVI
ncbi:MAG: sugar ABC transporter permease [Acidiferrobacteraceae bacterium]|nr:sugar ABC transporter permease [Acidiferrobacteraceae bacterium]|tara:strand:- start:1070 stop:1876 length:807 start_codon:yes stop_codon:yes gene_type:complete